MKETHIEITNSCQAECPMCPRTVNKPIASHLTLEWVQDNIDITNLEKVLFCGNLGDPAAYTHLLEIIKDLKQRKPSLVIGLNTNGGLQNTQWWEKLAKLLSDERDYVVFSIDGLEDTNHLYRINTNFNKIISNAKAFINAGGNAHWEILVFEHNKHQVNKCIDFAKEIGFKYFRTKITDRWDYYPNTNLNPTEILIPPAHGPVTCERDKDQSSYYDANGTEWPCCHLAEAYYLKSDPEILKFSPEELFFEYQNRLIMDPLNLQNPFKTCQEACSFNASRLNKWRAEIKF